MMSKMNHFLRELPEEADGRFEARLPPGTGVNDPAFVTLLRLLEREGFTVTRLH